MSLTSPKSLETMARDFGNTMHNKPRLRSTGLTALLAMALTAAGCGEEAPLFDLDPGQPPKPFVAYPPAPYGLHTGSTIPDFLFFGFIDQASSSGELTELRLADFHNPQGLNPEKPNALLIHVLPSWCASCKEEARVDFARRRAQFRPCGGELLIQLSDGPTEAKAATPEDLRDWMTETMAEYPAVIDPAYRLGKILDATTMMASVVVDTRTMKIIEAREGAPDASLWASFESLLESDACQAM